MKRLPAGKQPAGADVSCLPGPECSCDTVCNGPGGGIELLIKQRVVLIVIYEAHLHQNGGNVALTQYHQIGAFIDTQVLPAHFFQLPVDIGGNGAGRQPGIVYKAFQYSNKI